MAFPSPALLLRRGCIFAAASGHRAPHPLFCVGRLSFSSDGESTHGHSAAGGRGTPDSWRDLGDSSTSTAGQCGSSGSTSSSPLMMMGISSSTKSEPSLPEAERKASSSRRDLLGKDGPTLQDFLKQHHLQHQSTDARPAPEDDVSSSSSPSPSSSSSSSAIPQPSVGANEDITIDEENAATRGLRKEDSGLAVYLETYGCQMNVSDSQVVMSILGKHGYREAAEAEAADVILVNTCAIRENAESKVWQRLGAFRNMKTKMKRDKRPTVGVLGCMAERLKAKLLESDKLVDLVVGPDAYRDLPRLLSTLRESSDRRTTMMNVQLSLEETYADVMPVRRKGSVSAYLSIMRGCNNMCAFCIVPFTRGRERSRDVPSILQEVKSLSEAGVKEVTLLGQNVNSYADYSYLPSSSLAEDTASSSGDSPASARGTPDSMQSAPSQGSPEAAGDDLFKEHYAPGFRSVYKPKRSGAVTFAELLRRVAEVDPEMRIRFTSPHPKDFTDDVLDVIEAHPNICSHLHMPAQSGSTAMLDAMRRGYTREAYDALITRARQKIPQVALSTDIIVGFCGETEQDHAATLSLMRDTTYDQAFMFAYSRRDKTYAARHLEDDVPEEVKQRRLAEVIAAFREGLTARNETEIGRRHIVLVDGPSKRDSSNWTGRTDTFKRAVFHNDTAAAGDPVLSPGSPADAGSSTTLGNEGREKYEDLPLILKAGDYAEVQVVAATAGTLRCVALGKTTIAEFVSKYGSTTPEQTFDHASAGIQMMKPAADDAASARAPGAGIVEPLPAAAAAGNV